MERPSLRQLEVVAALAEHLSFRRAAVACLITQPALSAQLQQLETMLGLRLFERDRRHVVPTPAGTELAERARRALAEIDVFLDAARQFQEPLAGPLRVGVIPTVAPYVLPRVVPPIHKAYPRLKLYLLEGQTSRLVELVKAGKLDLLLLALEAELEDLETLALYADPFLVAVPREHPLSSKERVSESDLADGEVLLLEEGHCLRDQALDLCRRVHAHEAGDFRATSLTTLVRMVAGGLGITLLPSVSLDAEIHGQDRISVLPLGSGTHGRTLGLAWRRSSPRKREFELLAELFRAHPPKGARLSPASAASRARRALPPSRGS